MLPKKDLEAIHKQDIKVFLEKWGLLPTFKAHKIKCQFCGDIIDENNIGAISSKDKQILFACAKLGCLAKLST